MDVRFENPILEKREGDTILKINFNGKEYEFSEEDKEFVVNEKDSNLVVLFWPALNRICLDNDISITLDQIIKNSYNSVCVVVTLKNNKTGVARTSVIGLNQNNTDAIGKDNVDSTAFNRAKIRAFLELYGLPSERIKLNPAKRKKATSSGAALNLNATGDSSSTEINDVQAPKSTSPTSTSSSENNSKSYGDVTMPFGRADRRGRSIKDIISEDIFGGISYFCILADKNEQLYEKGEAVVALREALINFDITTITDDEEAICKYNEGVRDVIKKKTST